MKTSAGKSSSMKTIGVTVRISTHWQSRSNVGARPRCGRSRQKNGVTDSCEARLDVPTARPNSHGLPHPVAKLVTTAASGDDEVTDRGGGDVAREVAVRVEHRALSDAAGQDPPHDPGLGGDADRQAERDVARVGRTRWCRRR